MIEVAAAVLSAVAGSLAAVVASFVKLRLERRKKEDGHLKFEIEGRKTVDVPVAKDLSSLQGRVKALAEISPRLAILDGWLLVETAVLRRARVTSDATFDPSQNILQIARVIPGITPETIANLEKLRRSRNLVAHSAGEVQDGALTEAVDLIVPILSEIGLLSAERTTVRDEA